MQRYDVIAMETEMFVKSIAATCDTTSLTTKRTMSLVDLDAARKGRFYNSIIDLSMEAPDGVAAGDVVTITVQFKRDTIEEELIRQAERDTQDELDRIERANG